MSILATNSIFVVVVLCSVTSWLQMPEAMALPVEMGQFPGKVSLHHRDGSFFCAGTLISTTHILTAAHCVIDDDDQVMKTETIDIIAGDVSLNQTDPGVYRVHRIPSKITVHKSYNDEKIGSDLAILEVSDAFRTMEGILMPASLSKTTPSVGSNCVSGSWGDNFSGSNQLSRIEQQIVEKSNCAAKTSNLKDANWFCVGSKENRCQGLYGDELICDGRVVGIASLAFDCRSEMAPGVYIDLAKFGDWIDSVTTKTGDQPKAKPNSSTNHLPSWTILLIFFSFLKCFFITEVLPKSPDQFLVPRPKETISDPNY